MADPPPPRLTRLGHYRIEREIGRGGMATVYEAVHTELGRRVAIKVVSEAIRDNPNAAARFAREARLLARLRHPHIVAATDLDSWEGRPYFVMELLEGPTLAAHRHAHPRLPLPELVEIFLPITSAVAAAHASGIVHRDLKPSNVLLARRGSRFHPTVLDFGISTTAGDQEEDGLTRTGAVIGTVSYLSPEQAQGARNATALSDQYALGVMLYECATGELPFQGESAYQRMHAIVTEKARPPSLACAELPKAFDEIVLRAMHRDPSRRFRSVAALGRALLDLADDRTRAIWRDELEQRDSVQMPAAVAAHEPADNTLTEEPVLLGGRPPPLDVGAAHADEGPTAAPRTSRRGRWMGAILALAVAGTAAGLLARRGVAPAVSDASSSVRAAVGALAGDEARLACPIFEVRGASDAAVRLGAAAATLACARSAWNLGGRDDRVLPPAALLGIPRQPVDGLADPYAAPEQRKQTVALARARAAAYLDGVVTYDHDSWLVELVVRAPDDREIVRAQATEATFLAAMKKALEGSWRPPLVRHAIDRDVARWTSLPDVDVGLAEADVKLFGSRGGCAAARPRALALGNAFFSFEKLCAESGAAVAPDAGSPNLDESSPEALVTSVGALAARHTALPVAEQRRLATKLEELRDSERSSLGRALLADGSGSLWASANDLERAQASLRLSLREDPLRLETWHLIVTTSAETGSAAATISVASAWFPSEARFVAGASSYRGDELAARLRDTWLAYVLEPGFERAMHLGRALAEAGRADDARAVAATPLEDAGSNRLLESYVLAFIDLHDGKLARAIDHLDGAGDIGMLDLVVVADVAGKLDDVATTWAARFMSLPDDRVDLTARGYEAPMVLCMMARRDLTKRCLDRITRLDRASGNWWDEGGEALLDGARRYAAGDLHGAVSAWRSLVAGPNAAICRLLPSEAFERAGEPQLAARLDARKMPFTFLAGVSDAAPREAKRALAGGDKARARALAESVLRAWEVADTDIPAVPRMRALLASLER